MTDIYDVFLQRIQFEGMTEKLKKKIKKAYDLKMLTGEQYNDLKERK